MGCFLLSKYTTKGGVETITADAVHLTMITLKIHTQQRATKYVFLVGKMGVHEERVYTIRGGPRSCVRRGVMSAQRVAI